MATAIHILLTIRAVCKQLHSCCNNTGFGILVSLTTSIDSGSHRIESLKSSELLLRKVLLQKLFSTTANRFFLLRLYPTTGEISLYPGAPKELGQNNQEKIISGSCKKPKCIPNSDHHNCSIDKEHASNIFLNP